MVMEDNFGTDAVYKACQYGDPPPEVGGFDTLIMVDFSFPLATLKSMAFKLKKLVVLDHHKSAMEDLKDAEAMLKEMYTNCETNIVFDMGKCGCRLAWEYFNEVARLPILLGYVEDRDLWQWKLEDSHDINAAICSYPMEPDVWLRLRQQFRFQTDLVSFLKDVGGHIRRYQTKVIIPAIVKRSTMIEHDGFTVPCVNVSERSFISDALQELCKGHPYALGYYDKGTHREFHLRSDPDGEDVSEIAKSHGGGGHKHAAGYREPLAGVVKCGI